MAKRSPEVTSKLMSRIKSTGTKAEILVGKSLWRLGLRYRKNYRDIKGKPDFVFVSARVLVFCDGDFWHGRYFEERVKRGDFHTNRQYWLKKIPGNMKRDKETNEQLKNEGWFVLRYWESDILKNPEKIAEAIAAVVRARLKKSKELAMNAN